MSLSKKTTDRQGIGRMVVYMTGGVKPTESVFCARADTIKKYSEILQINGDEAELKKVMFNGVQIYPEKTTMDTKELCVYLGQVGPEPKPNTVKGWVRMKKIPFHKAGQAKNSPTYFVISEIDKWLEDGRK